MLNLDVANKYMNENKIDAWLIYDFKGKNHVAHEVLGEIPIASRRYFIIIENGHEPIIICNTFAGWSCIYRNT